MEHKKAYLMVVIVVVLIALIAGLSFGRMWANYNYSKKVIELYNSYQGQIEDTDILVYKLKVENNQMLNETNNMSNHLSNSKELIEEIQNKLIILEGVKVSNS